MKKPIKNKLYSVGIGLKGMEQITREAEKIIGHADKVYHLIVGKSAIKELRKLNESTESLTRIYFSHEKPYVTYNRIVDFLIQETRRYKNIAFVNYGHPLFLVDTTLQLIQKSQTSNLFEVEVIPGVSSFDTVIADLGVDISESGSQIIEVNDLLAYRTKLNPKMACFIFQVGTFGTYLRTLGWQNKPSRFKPLQEILLQYYRPNHKAHLVISDMKKDVCKPSVFTFPLGSMAQQFPHINGHSSLFIPPQDPRLENHKMIKQMLDPGFVKKIAIAPND